MLCSMTESSPPQRDARGYFWIGFMAGTANALVLVIIVRLLLSLLAPKMS